MTEPLKEIKEAISFAFSAEEEKVYKCFKSMGDGSLATIFEGTVRVMQYKSNPDRLAQAAHSIRKINMILTRDDNIKRDENIQGNDELDKKTLAVQSAFDELLKHIPVSNGVAKEAEQQAARQKLNDLLDRIVIGAVSMRAKLKMLYGTPEKFESLPKPIQEALNSFLKNWSKAQEYFNGLSKSTISINETEFMEKWSLMLDCWWSACCIFLEGSEEVKSIMERGLSNE